MGRKEPQKRNCKHRGTTLLGASGSFYGTVARVSDLPVAAHRRAQRLASSVEVEAFDPSQFIDELGMFEDPALERIGIKSRESEDDVR